ncbi:magnesium transporter [Alteromonadaceae bacterium Bs31]|nr:magnesium transporter [Alteromonadaceae bacterium Bs31]
MLLAEEFNTYLSKVTYALSELEGDNETTAGPSSLQYWLERALVDLVPEQYALLLESLPPGARQMAFRLLPAENQKRIFLAMQEESRRALIKQLGPSDAVALFDELDAQALLELAEELPDQFINEAFKRLDKADKERFERASRYSGAMAGHWVNFDFPLVYGSLKVVSAARLLKRLDFPFVDSLYLQDKQGILLGEVPLKDVISAETQTTIQGLLGQKGECIQATTPIDEAAERVILSGRMALPVIEDDGRILGRLLLSTAYEHREELAEQQISVAGGLSEDEDLFAPVWRSSKNRAIWLGINLLTAFLASWCIGLFEATLQQVVALAILMPVVASMGGISGSQTLTIIVRALALGKINDANRRAVLKKELRVGIVNGVLWALIIGVCVDQWFGQFLLGLTIALAILVNIIVAVVSGVLIPAILVRLKIDPALSGSVVLTTVTDVVGFVVFLGAGALILT